MRQSVTCLKWLRGDIYNPDRGPPTCKSAVASLDTCFAKVLEQFSLTRTYGTRVTIRTLVQQMDTSERMINVHYGHDDIEDYRDELQGE